MKVSTMIMLFIWFLSTIILTVSIVGLIVVLDEDWMQIARDLITYE